MKVGARGEDGSFTLIHRRLEIDEVDAGERLLDVEVAGFTIEAEAVPVEHTVGGIGILLDFMDEQARADGMESAGGNENGFAGLRFDRMDEVGGGSIGDGLLEIGAGDTFLQSDVKFRTWIAIGDEPHFGFRLAAEMGREFRRRVDLEGKVIPGIEDFDEDGETVVFGKIVAENFVALIFPEIVKGGAGVGALVGDGLGILPINDFP